MDELASVVGKTPTEQYAASCRAMRAAGTGSGGPRAFGAGGPGGSSRCAKDDPGGPASDMPRDGTRTNSVPVNLEPSKWNDEETVTIDVVENNDDDDDDDDDQEDDDKDKEEEEVIE